MDKVIIDGIDVSGCEHANACDKKLKCVILQDDVCETKPYCEGYNCYYKQLKRLQAENEQIKKDYAKLHIDFAKCNEENERLKEEINRNGREWENHCNALYWQMQSIIDKYKQALQEIREIAEEQLQDVSDRCINTTPMYIVHKHILDKINEVIGAEE